MELLKRINIYSENINIKILTKLDIQQSHNIYDKYVRNYLRLF